VQCQGLGRTGHTGEHFLGFDRGYLQGAPPMDVMVFPTHQPTCVVEQHWHVRQPQELAGCLDVAFENGVSGP
jgi:hypothetical protein